MSRDPDDAEPTPDERASARDAGTRQGGQEGQHGKASAQDSGRSPAEWVSFGISLAILLLVIGLLGYEHFTRDNRPPTIEAQPRLEMVRHEGDLYYLPVDVANQGDQTAGDVQVAVTLKPGPDAKEETAEFAVLFLAGGQTAHGTAVLTHDPAQGELTVQVTSFTSP
jgi:uncharacterized protein (TIGR02588 family)